MKLADYNKSGSNRQRAARSAQPARRATTARSLDTDRLDSMLGDLEQEHTHLLDLAIAHKDALTHASVADLNAITMQTSEVLVRIAEIEDARQTMITNDTGSLASLDQLMEQFNTSDRDRIGKRQARLRDLIARVRDEQNDVRVASENLANHMRGLIKQVGASLSHAGTYSRAGAVAPSKTQVISSLDVVQ